MKLPPFIVSPLAAWAQRVINGRAPDRGIGPRDNRYMLRWFVLRKNPWFNIYLHHFLRNDDDRALHDHPWSSLSITLSGRMNEIYAPPRTVPGNEKHHARRVIALGDVTLRGAQFSHRIELFNGVPAITLFITGPDIREWGFWCPQGWRPWQMYAEHNETTGEIGRGCN